MLRCNLKIKSGYFIVFRLIANFILCLNLEVDCTQ